MFGMSTKQSSIWKKYSGEKKKIEKLLLSFRKISCQPHDQSTNLLTDYANVH